MLFLAVTSNCPRFWSVQRTRHASPAAPVKRRRRRRRLVNAFYLMSPLIKSEGFVVVVVVVVVVVWGVVDKGVYIFSCSGTLQASLSGSFRRMS